MRSRSLHSRSRRARRPVVAIALIALLAVPVALVSSINASPPAGAAPVGSPVADDAAAAGGVDRRGFEPRPQNVTANQRRPSARELRAWRSAARLDRAAEGPPPLPLGGIRDAAYYLDRVTGAFRGTTDEILQWAAFKWGLDRDLLRAQAVQESRWRQEAVGDDGESFGLMQLKGTKQPGTFPLSRRSTAFNVDYAAMLLRHCFDGFAVWLGNGYRAGDLRGCLGYYFSGKWGTEEGDAYAERVEAKLAARAWERKGF